jgi:hypothetical protein
LRNDDAELVGLILVRGEALLHLLKSHEIHGVISTNTIGQPSQENVRRRLPITGGGLGESHGGSEQRRCRRRGGGEEDAEQGVPPVEHLLRPTRSREAAMADR